MSRPSKRATSQLDRRLAAARKSWQELHGGTATVVWVGAATCGRAAGALEVLDAVRATVEELSAEVHVVPVGCIGPCYLEPLLDIALPGQPRVSFGNVTPESARRLLTSGLENGYLPLDDALGHFGDEETQLGVPRFFDLPMLRPQVRLVLRNAGIIDPEDIDHYLARDGYAGLREALVRSPEEVIETVKAAGLRGRGGAGFPTWRKWEICRAQPGEVKYMICNVSEGDPGAFMNRSLIESDPHAVLEGLLIGAYAIGASHGYIYINTAYTLAIDRLARGIEEMHDLGLLGKKVLGTDWSFDITVKEGAGAFVCGEETAQIGSIEGRRGMPNSRPPFPAVEGLFGKPTIINNVETLGTLPHILRHGAAWYTKFGVEGNRGTKTFSLVGKVRRGGLIEVPLGTPLRTIIEDIGGGTHQPFKGVQTGGPSGGCLSAEFIDIPVEYESMNKAGSIMGSGGLIVMDASTCVVDLALYFLEFIQNESCGKCTPCRVGTWHMMQILERITRGKGTAEDLAMLQKLAETCARASLCGLGQTAPNPVLTTLRYFRQEYLDHVQRKECPALVCRDLTEYDIDPEICNGCHLCVGVCPTDAIAGIKAEAHSIDQSRCIKCKACYEVCRYDPVAGNAITIQPVGSPS
jgi:NADH:ubiquinone oxidoreductase subunit F (NADH-binding)/(2Fe-2S) ferredoxin/Pyruvate/2-oxoacid:ferredoxin oxidoreductase delta subunit